MILDAQDDIEVVASVGDGAAAIAAARKHRPEVVLMDIRMPALDGLEATRRLLLDGADAPKVIVLTTFDLDEYVFDALKSGASCFLLKDTRGRVCLRRGGPWRRGEPLLSPGLTRRLVERCFRPRPSDGDAVWQSLSERELDVVRLVARGLSNAEIAAELFLGEATVKTHVAHALGKLRLRDRVQVIVVAYETGLVEPGAGTPPPTT
jgi:DNA-binding NarL/FixJ family response regulator